MEKIHNCQTFTDDELLKLYEERNPDAKQLEGMVSYDNVEDAVNALLNEQNNFVQAQSA